MQFNFESAINDYTKAIELQPDRGLYYMGCGNAYLLNGELEKAKPDLEKAVELGETRAKKLLRQLPITK